MDPINYILDVKNPIEEAIKGYTMGRNDIAQRQELQIQRQNASMEQQAFADQQTALAEQRAAAAQQQAQAAAYQQDLMVLRDAAANGKLTPEMQNAFNLKYAANQAEIKTAFDAMSEPKQQEQTAFGINLVTSLLSGNADAAVTMLDERILAAENSGDTEEAAKLRANRKIIEMDPYAAAISIGSAMTAADAIKPDVWKSILDATQPKTPEGFQSLQLRAEAAGLKPGSLEYKKFMASGGDKGPLVQIGDQETSFAKAAGEKAAATFSGLIDQGVSASRSLAQIDNLENLLSGVETGLGAQFKSFLGQYGVDTAGLSDIQAANAAITQLVPTQRVAGSGTMTDKDVELFKSSLPSLINQPGANKLIIDTIRGINEYDVAASLIAGKVMDGVLTREEGRKALMEIPNPLAGFKPPKTTETTTAPAPTDAKATFFANETIKALAPDVQQNAWENYKKSQGIVE
jgi:hypothetical protein